ncbi:PIG-L deacetylase family protein [Mycolicibacterium aichiense]|uniref:Acetylglucosaminylphosphatidylinositol deacetylase n=1 Tax=Mycolicibacterium aichiense TaxID=1799 RepID=A0AAD1HMD8_9MYCO|nr:PIG-L family deacetylase [Mycolicibacterium aichiense]MCV7018615.1 PIG-L family deacetylase [Mycolicibacterium aichiense]BBX07374.1 acetylglucosaminylphosphatidylinositol deacetylase [Mycolicibacterium aichiense]STZ81188.1 putative LmbE-like protein [Mycolicibacterium aichiense]
MSAPTGNAARFAAVPISGGGTPADEWLRRQHPFPSLPLDQCPGLVVVAPHPDDETLGFGATACAVAARGVDVHTVIATDGGAAWPGLSAFEQARLEESRRGESQTAAAVLGLPVPVFLGLPDGRLTENESRLAEILTEILAGRPEGTWCAATWRGDGHPDHEVVGRAAAVATSRTGAVLLEYPIWMWHWARPGDDAVPWQSAVQMVADPVAVHRKREAVASFRSQLESDAGREPILPPYVLERLDRVGEVVFQ